jgi:hypothetical protein
MITLMKSKKEKEKSIYIMLLDRRFICILLETEENARFTISQPNILYSARNRRKC